MTARRRRLLVALAIIALAGVGAFAYGRWIEPERPVLETISFELPGLPIEADGFRIAFLADLHVREAGARERRMLELVRDADPDLILVGGDFVDVPYWMADYVRRAAVSCSLVAELPSRHGKVAVWGNNDIPEATEAIASAAGIRILENEQLELAVPGGSLTLVGVDDPVTGRASFDSAFARPPSEPYITMSHSPDAFADAVERDVPLLLVGHTHGGQIWTPAFMPGRRKLLRLREGTPNYAAGFYRSGGSTMYVTRGVGTSRVHFRLFCRPEVTLLELRVPTGGEVARIPDR